MNYSLLAGALLLCSGAVGTTRAMEKEAVTEITSDQTKTDSDTLSPLSLVFSIPDIRYKFMKFLCETKNIKEFKIFSCINKAAYTFFRGNEERTSTFAFDLLKISYSTDQCLNTLIKNLTSNLQKEEVELFQAKLAMGSALVSMCKDSQWDSLLLILKQGLTPSFLKVIINYQWKDTWESNTLLIKALKENAPEYVIEALLTLGFQVNNLPCHALPPCLVTIRNYLLCRQTLTLLTWGDKTTAAQEEKLKKLESIMDMLLKKGASLSDYFSIRVYSGSRKTPLSLAIEAHDLDTITYLIKKGALSFDPYALAALYDLQSQVDQVPYDLSSEKSYAIHKALFSIPSNPEHYVYHLLSTVLPQMFSDLLVKKCTTNLEHILELLSLALDSIEDINAPVPYEKDLTFLDIAHICGNDEQVLNLLIQKGATSNKSNAQKVWDVTLNLKKGKEALQTIPKIIRESFQVEFLRNIFAKIQEEIEKWGINGVPLPLIKNTLLLACSHPTLVEAAEFLKYIHTKQFRPFFHDKEWIISIELFISTVFNSSHQERFNANKRDWNVIELCDWLDEETLLNSSIFEVTTEDTDENWNELLQKALFLKPVSSQRDDKRNAIFVTAKKLVLKKEATSTSLFVVLFLLSLIDESLSEVELPGALNRTLAMNDFLKWAKMRGYLPETYSKEVATPLLKRLVSLCCTNLEIIACPERFPVFKLISWFAKHIQDREIFTEWKAVADFAREHDLLELAEHIEHTALLRLEEL